MKEKNERLTAADQQWGELVDAIEKDNKELRVKNSIVQKQNEECLAVIRALNETRFNLEKDLMESLAILESPETENGLEGKKKDESANLIEPSTKEDKREILVKRKTR